MNVLITGANRGIGRALFDGYRAAGDVVTGTSRGALPEGAGWQTLDVTDPASHRALAAQMDGTPLDLLVCNAGVYLDKGHKLDDGYDADLWAQQFAVNVTGVFLSIQSLMPNVRAGKGKIAILSSIMATQENAPGGGYIYRASKAAVLNLGRNLAVDLKPEGIPVGIYHPGWVQTDMGGAEAAITVDQASGGLIKRFASLSLDTTGCFEAYNGEALPF